MEAQQPPRCPRCSFIVFNRRHPKCESCDAELPSELLYSEAELQAIRKSGAEQLELELEHLREEAKERTELLRILASRNHLGCD
jgi:hypothetical protein